MPHFDIIRQSNPHKSFRVASVMGTFDLSENKVTEHFVGDIDLPPSWNIGVIVGRSGTGKTTIARELFGQYMRTYEYHGETILDDMPNTASMAEVERTFTSVGFSSPPSWLKPYSVLSNGEKMRVDLARCLLEKDDMFVFDEYTSVVDRNVAKVGSRALQKSIRRQGNKFIAVTCHEDVIDFLSPDWIFNTNDMTFSRIDEETQKKNRGRFNMRIYQINDVGQKKSIWRMFAKYHYLSANFNHVAKTFVATIDGNLAAMSAALPFPHPRVKNTWREHRTVVFPDYQGIGVGPALSNFVAQYFTDMGKKYISTTSNPAMIFARQKSPLWRCVRLSRCTSGSKNGFQNIIDKKSTSCHRITASFQYIGNKKDL